MTYFVSNGFPLRQYLSMKFTSCSVFLAIQQSQKCKFSNIVFTPPVKVV